MTDVQTPPSVITPDPVTTIEGTGTVTMPAGEHAVNDTITVRLVVCLLGLVALCIIIASTILELSDKTLPPELITLGGVAVGALGAMLASTASKRT